MKVNRLLTLAVTCLLIATISCNHNGGDDGDDEGDYECVYVDEDETTTTTTTEAATTAADDAGDETTDAPSGDNGDGEESTTTTTTESTPSDDEDDVKKAFDDWCKEYDFKCEEGTPECDEMYLNFKENYAEVQTNNKLYDQGLVSHKIGLNLWSGKNFDLDVKPTLLGSVSFDNDTTEEYMADEIVALSYQTSYSCLTDPKRKNCLPKIKDQERCAACWAFGVANSIEWHYCLQQRTKVPVELSVQQFIDCTFSNPYYNKGCYSGKAAMAYQYAGKYHYLCLENSCPFTGWHNQADCSEEWCSDYIYYTAYSPYYVRLPARNPQQMIAHLVQRGPLLVEMDCQKSFSSYTTGVYRGDPNCKPTNKRDHVLNVVGYGVENGIPYWLVQNTWGDWWGDNGFVKVERGRNICGIEEAIRYPKMKRTWSNSPLRKH